MLKVEGLTAGYGDIIAVRDFSFAVETGKTLALMAPNGAGKSSTLMALVRLVERKSGGVEIDGEDISGLSVESRIAKGIAIVPEGRRIFPDLSTRENLMVGGHIVDTATLNQSIESVINYFPRLAERQSQTAGSLPGGE